MLKIKRLVINVIAFIFGIFLTIKFYLCSLLVLVIGKLPLKLAQNLKNANNSVSLINSNKENYNDQCKKENDTQKVKQGHKIEGCFQSLIDSCISLCLTATLVNYNSFLVKGTLMISHRVHYAFLTFIYEGLPDYTQSLQDQYQEFLKWTFILCGCFGITTQIAFILDLIHVLTLPTKLIYAALRCAYSQLIAIIRKLYDFINTDPQKWLTCPYPPRFLTSKYRTSALMLLIILVQLTVFIIFYYLWLCLVIVCLLLIENTLENLYSGFSLLGYGFCYMKKYGKKKKQQEFQQLFVAIFDPQTALRIIKGTNAFKRNNKKQKSQLHTNKFSFLSVCNIFSSLSKNPSFE